MEAAPPLGLYAPGLDHLGTMLNLFSTVVDFRHYHLTDTTASQTKNDLRHIPRIKSQVEGLHDTLEPVTWFEPVKLLSFFSTVTSSLRALNKLEGVTVHFLAYLLSENAKYEYDAQINPGTETSPLQAPWPYVVHALIARFLTYNVLQVAHKQ